MTQTLTTDELRQIVESDHVQCGDAAAMARELLANREAQPVAVTDEMALAFHRALNDGGVGESDLEEIKVGLRGALCNITAPPAPAVVNGRTADGWMAEALLQKKISDDLRKSAPEVPEEVPGGLIEAINQLLSNDGSRGCYSAIECGFAREKVEQWLSQWQRWLTERNNNLAMLAQPVSCGYKLPDGWKLVPIDATRAMIDAAQRVEEEGYDAMHKAMLAAAPEGGK